MDLANISGKTDLSMLVLGNRIKSQVLASMIGSMAGAIKESGLRTICKAWAFTNGMTVVNSKVHI